MTLAIDLNADLGENCGDDAAMLGVVTSANIACGLHAGDPMTLSRTARLAAARGVRVGAHPSYPDRENFGRTSMRLSAWELWATLDYQWGAFTAVTGGGAHGPVYVKAHGALYNDAAVDGDVADALARLAARHGVALMGMPGSQMQAAADWFGARFIAEAFVDRAYRADGTLVPRSTPGAVLHDPRAVAARAVRMATEGMVDSIDGQPVAVNPQSLCVHGDTPGAVAIAQAVKAALVDAGVQVTAVAA